MAIALRCGYCRDALSPGEACCCAACLTPTHLDCYDKHGRCLAAGCGARDPLIPGAARRRSAGLPGFVALAAGLGLAAAGWLAAAGPQPATANPDAERLHQAALAALVQAREHSEALQEQADARAAAAERAAEAREAELTAQSGALSEKLFEAEVRQQRLEARLACLRAWAAAGLGPPPPFPALDRPRADEPLHEPLIVRGDRRGFEPFLQVARRFQEQRRYWSAIECYERILDFSGLKPIERGEAFAARGLILIKIGDFVPGVIDQSRAVSLDMSHAKSLALDGMRIGVVYDVEAVEKALAEALERPNTRTQVQFLRGHFYAYLAQKQPELYLLRAVKDLKAVLEAEPGHAPARLILAAMRSIQARYDEARRLLDQVLEQAKGRLPYARYLRAVNACRILETGPERREDLISEATRDLAAAFEAGFSGPYRLRYEVFAPLAGHEPFEAMKTRLLRR